MALVSTTLAGAIGASDAFLTATSGTTIAAGRLIRIDDEMMQIGAGCVAGATLVPVIRGIGGSAASAHANLATLVHGLPADFDAPGAQTSVVYQYNPVWRRVSYNGAANTLVLPDAGVNLHVILTGTTADTFTIPVPTVDITGSRLLISSNGVAQHILTFTGGLSGAGVDVDLLTVNATAPASFEFVAVDGLWHLIACPSGTLTKIQGVLA